VRNIRLIALIASALEAIVKIAGAATSVSAANGIWVNGVASIRFLKLELSVYREMDGEFHCSLFICHLILVIAGGNSDSMSPNA
jgi:hypothetical protein